MGNYLEQEEVINQAYISKEGFMKLIPICESRAKIKFKEIINEIEKYNENKEDEYKIKWFDSRPRLIPTSYVVRKYNIPVDIIRKEANKIKRLKEVK